jgi:hypothetical protein
MAAIAFVALLIARPGLLVTSRATPIPPNVPPTARSIPGRCGPRHADDGARPGGVGTPPALVFYSAAYLLCPRMVL